MKGATSANGTRDRFRERYVAAMRAIAAEELEHGPRRVPRFVAQYVKSEDDRLLATRLLQEAMAQHLRVRNELFAYPLPPERLAAIDRGEVEPWSMAPAASASAQ